MTNIYNPVTPELVQALQEVVGDKYVKTDEEYLQQYQTDEENLPISSEPEVVIYPGSTEGGHHCETGQPV